MSHKTLITSGCSFTQTELPCIDRKFNTWPQQLATKYNLNLINYGFFATGNSMIARTLIYGVSEFLKESKDLIVGVMWSGQDRHAFYSEDARRPAKFNMPIGPRNFIRTPIDVLHPNTQHTDMGGWINLLLGTSTIENFPYQHLNNAWYKNFNNRTFSEITTLENILWAQNFLELHNIDYFMSGFTDDSLTFNINNENIKWLYELINWDKFISTGMYEWCKEENLLQEHDDKHPSEEGHKKYTEQFIEPHLNARSLI